MSPPRLTSFLLKVASRCNLDCDYCYVYHHADQSWRGMPRLMSDGALTAFGTRLAEYSDAAGIKRFAVIFHGGEPLLAGAKWLADAADRLRESIPSDVRIDFGIQTNGLLLDDAALDLLDAAGVSISLSLDGPRPANDLHRTSRKGRSSFDRAFAALERLTARPKVFSGVISVIDARVPASELLDFFAPYKLPRLDFLLPDASHDRVPPGRDDAPNVYARWLTAGFDAWFDDHAETPVRLFEAVMDGVAGLPSGTDAFGQGDVSLLSVETDGTWHDLDVLKVAAPGATRLEGTVFDTSIEQVALSPRLAEHRRLLSPEGLPADCRGCAEAAHCGGGAVPHRYRNGSFDNPTAYCAEMLSLFGHVRRRLGESLAAVPATVGNPCRSLPFDLATFEVAETASAAVKHLLDDAGAEARTDLLEMASRVAGRWPEHRHAAATLAAADDELLRIVGTRPGTISWRNAMRTTLSGSVPVALDGGPLPSDPGYLETLVALLSSTDGIKAGEDDRWLQLPFGSSITFDGPDHLAASREATEQAIAIVDAWRPGLADEMCRVCRAVQFVQDPTAHPDKIVSFSDNSVPGALFVSMRPGGSPIDVFDLADSLIHEHRHQKLYLLERLSPMVRAGAARVPSPWREEPRPPSGLLHAVFVFVELRRFWLHVLENGPSKLRFKARNQVETADLRLAQGIATLEECPLMPAGRELLGVLDSARVETRTKAV